MLVEAKNAVGMWAMMKDHASVDFSPFLVSCLFSHITLSQDRMKANVPQGCFELGVEAILHSSIGC